MEIEYILVYHEKVKKDIHELVTPMRDKIKAVLEHKLLTNPEVFGVPLRASLKGLRKLRVEDWRVVFRIQHNTIFILAIKHRSNIYDEIEKRIGHT